MIYSTIWENWYLVRVKKIKHRMRQGQNKWAQWNQTKVSYQADLDEYIYVLEQYLLQNLGHKSHEFSQKTSVHQY